MNGGFGSGCGKRIEDSVQDSANGEKRASFKAPVTPTHPGVRVPSGGGGVSWGGGKKTKAVFKRQVHTCGLTVCCFAKAYMRNDGGGKGNRWLKQTLRNHYGANDDQKRTDIHEMKTSPHYYVWGTNTMRKQFKCFV